MKLTNFKQIEEVLRGYVPLVAAYGHDGMSLERMWPLLEHVGNPHKKLKAVHISGTSGKTSTAYFIAAQLKTSGNIVGLTVSPHIDSIAERIQINGQPLSEQVFATEFSNFLNLIEKSSLSPSYFELLIAFIYWEFVRQNVEYAVIETGMGGLLDATNVITRSDKVCVITDIGFDHMNVLGSTLSEIAAQKAGIIHEQNEVFMYEQSNEVMAPIKTRVKVKNAKLNLLSDVDLLALSSDDLSGISLFQQRNWLLASKVTEYIRDRDSLLVTELDPASVIVPARMEKKVLADGSVLIMDGSHNDQKVEAFINSYNHEFTGKKATIMLALKSGKDYRPVLDKLSGIAERLIITTFNVSQDSLAVSHNPQELKEYCQSIGLEAEVQADNRKATKQLMASKSTIKLIIGSFYLLGQVRRFIKSISGDTIAK